MALKLKDLKRIYCSECNALVYSVGHVHIKFELVDEFPEIILTESLDYDDVPQYNKPMKYKIVQNPSGRYSIYKRKSFLIWEWWVMVKIPSKLNFLRVTPGIWCDVSWKTVEKCESVISELESDKKPKIVKFV